MSQTKTAKKKAAKKFYGPDVYKRNGHGLLENAEYIFNEDGSVNWRAMIKPEFLYPNKGWFEARNKAVPTSSEGLDDKQLLIMLGGIKELAKMRGYHNVDFTVNECFRRSMLPQNADRLDRKLRIFDGGNLSSIYRCSECYSVKYR
jgi:hypothetical protein